MLSQGDEVTIPIAVAHRWWNAGQDELRVQIAVLFRDHGDSCPQLVKPPPGVQRGVFTVLAPTAGSSGGRLSTRVQPSASESGSLAAHHTTLPAPLRPRQCGRRSRRQPDSLDNPCVVATDESVRPLWQKHRSYRHRPFSSPG
jgi:hypothetical protein